jgi:hypothetical protein
LLSACFQACNRCRILFEGMFADDMQLKQVTSRYVAYQVSPTVGGISLWVEFHSQSAL